ncbi:hypothetical protein TGAM01_v204129 [Trichoderma gamsii]|uniref:RRM domain-containing protein n=1 Tax=Trichoderma gamsii TaxID=398673 RepID=A0A2P4ZSA5_9HYPO|nr:hypothetical protein TGAM01_v204129 [Trichoderma gamsii]PON27180.1 hypothetical protein TGAM01_v204129 [Trichoderma gamsii]
MASSPSKRETVCTKHPGSDLVQLEEHGSNIDLMAPNTQGVTLNESGPTDIADGDSFITASEHCLEHPTANNAIQSNRSDLVQNDRAENYKSQAECLAAFQVIENALCTHLHQLQLTQSKATDIESKLQDLPKEEKETNLLLAAFTFINSLASVSHIFTASIAMMEGAKDPASLSKMRTRAQPSDSPPVQTPAPASPAISISTISEEAQIEDSSSDLLLDCPPSDNDTTDLMIFDTPDRQCPATRNTGSSEIDPFIDAPQEAAARLETPDIEIRLEFHSDFTNLYGRRLYVPSLPSTPAAERSRRVILRNLPPTAKLSQIARGIQTHGQILSIMPLSTLPLSNDATKTVMVEFIHPKPTAELVRTIQVSPLIYEDANLIQYQASAWLVPTPSFGLSWVDKDVVSQKYSRSLMLKEFPSDYIWYFIGKVGLQHIVRVELDVPNHSLCIELTSMWQTRRVDELIWRGTFSDIFKYCHEKGTLRFIVPDVTQICDYNDRPPYGIIKQLPEDDLERQWNVHPYNRLPPHLKKEAVQQGPTRLSLEKRLALQHDIEEDEVEDLLLDLENHKDTDYKIIGSNITLTRRKWSWSMTDEDDTKLLMANTLHEPEWAEHWDKYFQDRGELNIRTWEAYGMMANHRREKAAEQGLDLGAVPKCDKGCEMGCQDLKKTPVDAEIKQWLKR